MFYSTVVLFRQRDTATHPKIKSNTKCFHDLFYAVYVGHQSHLAFTSGRMWKQQAVTFCGQTCELTKLVVMLKDRNMTHENIDYGINRIL